LGLYILEHNNPDDRACPVECVAYSTGVNPVKMAFRDLCVSARDRLSCFCFLVSHARLSRACRGAHLSSLEPQSTQRKQKVIGFGFKLKKTFLSAFSASLREIGF
jgi:hypothetical protein